jgi:DNA mismatch repair protein MutS
MHLAQQVGALTLFATHYFELTQLAEIQDNVSNVHVTAVEHNDTIRFMHSICDGAASQSYGLHVAQLAGVPNHVLDRAKRKLSELESQNTQTPTAIAAHEPQLSLLQEPDSVRTELNAINPDELTPRQALDELYRLTKIAKQ